MRVVLGYGKVVQAVRMDLPLFIRMLEYAREDAKTDMDLHVAAEKAVRHQHGVLTMKDYKDIVGGGMPHFVEAIERKYDAIQSDYRSNKKEGHWSWFLFPLLRESGQTPSAGTSRYYLDGEQEIAAYLNDDAVRKYYKEALEFLASLVRKGKAMRRPMSYDQSLKGWLGGQDYHKVVKHISQFRPVAQRLHMTELLRLYNQIIPRPKIKPVEGDVEDDAFEREFS